MSIISSSYRRRTCATRFVTPLVSLSSTKVDAQCDKLATVVDNTCDNRRTVRKKEHKKSAKFTVWESYRGKYGKYPYFREISELPSNTMYDKSRVSSVPKELDPLSRLDRTPIQME